MGSGQIRVPKSSTHKQVYAEYQTQGQTVFIECQTKEKGKFPLPNTKEWRSVRSEPREPSSCPATLIPLHHISDIHTYLPSWIINSVITSGLHCTVSLEHDIWTDLWLLVIDAHSKNSWSIQRFLWSETFVSSCLKTLVSVTVVPPEDLSYLDNTLRTSQPDLKYCSVTSQPGNWS